MGMSKSHSLSVYSFLVEAIRSNRFAPGDALPSENELAKLFSLSRPTIRRAIERLDREGFILRKQGIGSFVRSEQSVARGDMRPRVIALDGQSHAFNQVYYSAIAAGARRAAGEGAMLCLSDFNEVVHSAPGRFDGLICTMAQQDDFDTIAELEKQGIPTVLVNRYPQNPALSYVAVDFHRESFQIVRRLLLNGARRVGMFNCRNVMLHGRMRGWSDAYTDCGLPVPHSLIVEEGLVENHCELLVSFLERERPQVLFVAAAFLMPVMIAARSIYEKNGGEPVDLICFDDVEELFRGVPVSYIKMPLEIMGNCAVEYLLKKKENPGLPPLRETFSASVVVNRCNYLI